MAQPKKVNVVTVRRPLAILMDISGPIAKQGYMGYSKEMRHFVKRHLKDYLIEEQESKNLRADFNFMKIQEREDRRANKLKGVPQLPEVTADRKTRLRGMCKWVYWKIDNGQGDPALALFQLHMTEWGYRKQILKTPVYDEVAGVLASWTEQNIKVYITLASFTFANLILTNTTAGDLSQYIEGHINLVEVKESGRIEKNFEIVSPSISVPSERILFITRLPHDAYLARACKIKTILVLRVDYDAEVYEKRTEGKQLKRSARDHKVNEEAMNRISTALNRSTNQVVPQDETSEDIIQDRPLFAANREVEQSGTTYARELASMSQNMGNDGASVEELKSVESTYSGLYLSDSKSFTSVIEPNDLSTFSGVYSLADIVFHD